MEPSKASFRRFLRWLVLIVVTAIIVVAGLSIVAHGADATAPAPSGTESTPGQSPAPLSWLTPEVITAAFGLVAAIIAVIQNRQKATVEKVRDTLILGIEHGATLAERTGNPEATKYAVHARAVAAGLEKILAPRVTELTKFSGHEEHAERVALEQKMQLPPPPSAAAP